MTNGQWGSATSPTSPYSRSLSNSPPRATQDNQVLSELLRMHEAEAIAAEVENIHLRNETLRMQHALVHTRGEVSSLEGDLSVVQAETKLKQQLLPKLRNQVEDARHSRAAAESEAAELAAELALYQAERDGSASLPLTAEQRNRSIQARHAKRLEESSRLQAVREMRDTLSNSALEAVLVDEIADVEREIREMHHRRQELHQKLQGLSTQRAELLTEITEQRRQLDGAELELEELARKKEELANMQALGVAATQEAATPADRRPMLQKEKIELDQTLIQMQTRLTEAKNGGMVDGGELQYLEELVNVLKNRQTRITSELDGSGNLAQQEAKP